MRLFTAIELSQPFRRQVAEFQTRLVDRGVRGRFPPEENLHLTLCFLGETRRVLEAGEVIHALRLPRARLVVAGYGAFAKGETGYLAMEEDSGLMEIRRMVCAAYRDAGFPLEKRPYLPHITLGRRLSIPADVDPASICAPMMGTAMEVSGISLMESIPGSGAPVYRRRLYVPVCK